MLIITRQGDFVNLDTEEIERELKEQISELHRALDKKVFAQNIFYKYFPNDDFNKNEESPSYYKKYISNEILKLSDLLLYIILRS